MPRRKVMAPSAPPTGFVLAMIMMMMMSDAMFVQMSMLISVIGLPWRLRSWFRLTQFLLETPFDARVFLVGFDLLDFERDAEPLRKIAFGDRVIAGFGRAAVEVLVIPEVWGRDYGARLPIDLHRVVGLLEAVLAREREAAAVERENDRFVGVTMAELVCADLEFGHVWFENRVARHLPKHTRVAAAALFPYHHFGVANVAHEIGLVPTLAHPRGLGEVIWLIVIAIGEIEVEVIDQFQAAEHLQHKRKRRDGEQPRRMRRI